MKIYGNVKDAMSLEENERLDREKRQKLLEEHARMEQELARSRVAVEEAEVKEEKEETVEEARPKKNKKKI